MMMLPSLKKKDGVYDDITRPRRPSIQRSKAFASNLYLVPIKSIAATMYLSNTSLDSSCSSPAISTDSILEFFFPLLLMKRSTNTIHNNNTMKRVESSSTMSTLNSSIGEVGIIDDDRVVKYSYRVIKRVLSAASFCLPHDMNKNNSNNSSERSLQPSLKKRAKKSFANVPEYVGGTCDVEMSPLPHDRDTADAAADGEGYGWFINAEDFNLYSHYFK